MPLALSSPIIDVLGIGPAKAKLLQKLRIERIRDLLYTFPRRYDDFSRITPIAQLRVGEKMTVRGKVQSVKSEWGWRGRRRTLRIFVDMHDDSGHLHVIWYNLQFLSKQLPVGREIYVAGEVKTQDKQLTGGLIMHSPVIEFISAAHDATHTARIIPVYPETAGVTSRFLRYHIKQLLPLIRALPEYLPEEIQRRHALIGVHQALYEIHFPTSSQSLEEAQRRLRFDELFFLQLAAITRRRALQKEKAFPIHIEEKKRHAFEKKLGFTLTGAQQQSISEITHDLSQPHPMNRLLQGDVGSGKSAVALLAAQIVTAAGYAVVYLAPTEILARQQYQSFRQALGENNVELLIGAINEKKKKDIKKRLLTKDAICYIGTHALVQENVKAQRLALAIIDEQHRFGVTQRHALRHMQAGVMPHLLSMTATPIPRTLNLTVYGDLEVSLLNELPPGRKPIETIIVTPPRLAELKAKIEEEIRHGRQAYIIAPLVSDSEKLQIKSAITTEKEMQHLFPRAAVGLVHGQLKTSEKESIMNHFTAGAIQILVATAVVEVGVNVPNATVMCIQAAERFGLAQLHQLRGRIGRGEHASTCYLIPSDPTFAANPRLEIIAATSDGFRIAEEDLKLRGPGEVYGIEQSGFTDLKVASLLDYPTIKSTRQEAGQLLNKDPKLERYPILQGKVRQKNWITHFE